MEIKPTKGNKPKSGFVIKLSCETVQKLNEEDQQTKSKDPQSSNEQAPSDVDEKELNRSVTVTSQSTGLHSKDESETRKHGNKEDSCHIKQSKDTSPNDKGTKTTTISKDIAESSSGAQNAWGDYAPYVTYDGEKAIYTDPSTQQRYTWNKESNSWDPVSGTTEVPGREYGYEDDAHIYTEPDGSKFFWDVEKKAWIPKVDDDFLAYYQMSYGFIDNTTKEPEKKDDAKKLDEEKKAELATGIKRKSEPQWFEPSEDTNTKAYVSNLPEDISEEEFVNFMQKCGLVERDPSSQKMKVKLYMDKEHNCFKGDALCTYIKIESVDLALKLLDGSDYKGHKIKVERAHFQLKGEYNPALKPKKKKKKELEKIKKMQQKLFDWRPEKFIGERSKHERVVIVKNLFLPSDFDKEVQLILDYQQDLREECSKVGEVRKVVIYDRHPEGVAQITMKDPEMADAAVQLINGRWFGKRQITAEIWDGKTKYKIGETDADINQRIDKWDKFLEGKEDEDKQKTERANETSQPVAVTVDVDPELKNEVKQKTEAANETSQPAAVTVDVDPELKNEVKQKTEAANETSQPAAVTVDVDPELKNEVKQKTEAANETSQPAAVTVDVDPELKKEVQQL